MIVLILRVPSNGVCGKESGKRAIRGRVGRDGQIGVWGWRDSGLRLLLTVGVGDEGEGVGLEGSYSEY